MANKLTNSDLQAIADLLDKQTAVLATKEELKDQLDTQSKELKAYIHEGIETVMTGMDNVANQLAEKKQVERLEDWAKVVGDKVGLKPKL